MASEERAAGISRHPPTEGDSRGAETREETIERVVEHGVAPEPVEDASLAEDPSTSRGISRLVGARWLGIGVGIGAIVGAIVALASWAVLDTDVLGSGVGRIALVASIVLAGAIIGGILSGLVNLAREDGRVQREVEQDYPEAQSSPGMGVDSSHDPPREE